jgi:transcriptional regulator with XRE-family HTH domain
MTDTVQFDVGLMQEDMAAKGWLQSDLASAASVSDMTVTRFFRGDHRTNRTAKKLARALGYSVRRYLVRQSQEAA